MRWARLELAQDYSHYPLKVACLPFHHHRFVCFGIAKVRKILLPPNFSAIFFHFFDVFLQKGAFFRSFWTENAGNENFEKYFEKYFKKGLTKGNSCDIIGEPRSKRAQKMEA